MKTIKSDRYKKKIEKKREREREEKKNDLSSFLSLDNPLLSGSAFLFNFS